MSCCTCIADPLAPFSLDYYVADTVGISAAITLDGVAYDLTGCAVAFTLSDTAVNPAVVLWPMAIGSGVAIISLSGGTVLITPSLAQSQALTAGRTYYCRLVVTSATGAVITSAEGYLRAR